MVDKKRARKVATRTRFLEKVVAFAETFVPKHGRNLVYSEHSCHTHTVDELKDFNGLSLLLDSGQSMMGGNRLIVWYHPGRKFDEKVLPVLEMSWQVEVEKCVVKTFVENTEWQSAMRRLMKSPKEAVARFERAKAAAKKRALAEQREKEESRCLEVRAQQLRIS